MPTITTEHVAALRNAEQYAQACNEALRDLIKADGPPVLGQAAIRLFNDAHDLFALVCSLRVAAENEAGAGGQQ